MKGRHKFNFYAILAVSFVILAIVLLLAAYISIADHKDLIRHQIALIPIRGEISSYGGDGFYYEMSASDVIMDQIKTATKDNNVKAIILEINSPGGSVVASKEIADIVKKSNKPVVAWIREVGASGAYWIASASDLIVADAATITGSIGVTGSYLEFSELMEKYGIGYEELTSGKYKDSGSQFKDLSEEERTLMLSKINKLKVLFVREIAENRNLDISYVNNLATGEIFLGEEAKDLGLVDVLGNRDTAQKEAEKLAGIKHSEIVVFKKEATFSDLLSKLFTKQSYDIGRGIGDSLVLKSKSKILAV